jgi:two-component system chemotaxis response regulator CheB
MEAHAKPLTEKVKVLIVDDSPTVCLMLSRILEADPGIMVLGTASNGADAIDKITRLKPDLVTMDVNMPVMDGIEAIEHIMAYCPLPVIVLSSVVDSEVTTNAARALGAGAVDVISKPSPDSLEDFESIAIELQEKIKLLSRVKVITHPRARLLKNVQPRKDLKGGRKHKRVIAIASSTGGPAALQSILCSLPQDFKASILIVQHIASGFTDGLVEWLSRCSKLKVVRGRDGMKLEEGEVIIAPEGFHMMMTPRYRVRLSDRYVAGPHKPSADVLLESVAESCGREALGIILSGMGHDGAAGIKEIHDRGGSTIAQDEKTSVIYGMANEAVKLGGVDEILPLTEISKKIMEQV